MSLNVALTVIVCRSIFAWCSLLWAQQSELRRPNSAIGRVSRWEAARRQSYDHASEDRQRARMNEVR